ncbi:MAG: hypothetical protein ACI4TL_03645 [Candidatus Cryptobacteroides sp.]
MRGIALIILSIVLDIIPAGEAFLKALQPRDSVLVADQFEYGFTLEAVEPGTVLGLADFEQVCNDTLVLVRNWQIDTLKNGDISGSVLVAPFEEGLFALPSIYVIRQQGEKVDTLRYAGQTLKVCPIQVDTATFQIHPLKEQINYPLTFAELAPYIFGSLLGIALIVLAIIYLPRLFRKKSVKEKQKDPPHVVALRELDRYRSDKYWAPAQQKAFYSGITDILKTYIDERFAIDAPEMTTEELFRELKSCSEVDGELYAALKELFERADFVKFAKFVADDKENAQAVPLCVRFVTSTYQAQIEEESKNVL